MARKQPKSGVVREQFLELAADSKQKDMETAIEPEVAEGYRGRSDVVLERGGRTWYIEVDTCFGHSSERLNIVPGLERLIDEPESEPEPETVDEEKTKGLFLSTAQKTRLLGIANIMLNAPKRASKMGAKRVSMVQLLEEDSESDPALNIPMFGPITHAPPPLVEIGEEEALQQSRQPRRLSVLLFDTSGPTPLASGIDPRALASAQAADDEEDEDDLLEGFGNRPEKRTVQVRKFVRRNKFLKKVFRKKDSSSLEVHIGDDNYE